MLEGVPLALELAAARPSLLSPVQLRDRLSRSSDLLRDDRRDRLERHRSLRATLQWTLGLLEEPARELFVRLGAFAGPVELEEIEAVAGADGLNVLDAVSDVAVSLATDARSRAVALIRRGVQHGMAGLTRLRWPITGARPRLLAD
jgi:predicted ATPase